MTDLVYFEDRVAGMRADAKAARVEVRFTREPIVLWVAAAEIDLVDRLADAVEAQQPVSVAWRGDTQEIVSVVPADGGRR